VPVRHRWVGAGWGRIGCREVASGYDMHIDHRSYQDQGVVLEPTSHLGKAVDEMRTR
jgi:hypothetical protein